MGRRAVTSRVTVVSTGLFAPTKAICLASVAAQRGVAVDHVYIEAGEQAERLTVSENLFRAIHALPPERIVAWIDGDDWLAHPMALARAAKEHESGAWVTYGQFMYADGAPGFAAPYAGTEVREQAWKATHLKTFRAGLFQRIDVDDLQLDGEWVSLAVDMAIMFPMLEMAGPGRARFISDVLYVYNFRSSFQANANPRERARELECDRRIRAKRPYALLEEGAPWVS